MRQPGREGAAGAESRAGAVMVRTRLTACKEADRIYRAAVRAANGQGQLAGSYAAGGRRAPQSSARHGLAAGARTKRTGPHTNVGP